MKTPIVGQLPTSNSTPVNREEISKKFKTLVQKLVVPGNWYIISISPSKMLYQNFSLVAQLEVDKIIFKYKKKYLAAHRIRTSDLLLTGTENPTR